MTHVEPPLWAASRSRSRPPNKDAQAFFDRGFQRRDRATPKERALIDATAVRYVKDFRADRRVDQDRAYAEAMQKVADQIPDDLEILTLYADALFLLEPLDLVRHRTRAIGAA